MADLRERNELDEEKYGNYQGVLKNIKKMLFQLYIFCTFAAIYWVFFECYQLKCFIIVLSIWVFVLLLYKYSVNQMVAESLYLANYGIRKEGIITASIFNNKGIYNISCTVNDKNYDYEFSISQIKDNCNFEKGSKIIIVFHPNDNSKSAPLLASNIDKFYLKKSCYDI